MSKSDKLTANYFKTKYDIDLGGLENVSGGELVEPSDMDIFHIVKMLNSLPEHRKELYNNNVDYKWLVDKIDEVERLPETLGTSKKSKKIIQDEFKDVVETMNRCEADALFEFLESKINISEGHIEYKTDDVSEINYYKQTALVLKNEREYGFDRYCENVFKYQYEFCKLSDNIDNNRFILYESLATNNEWQDIVSGLISRNKPMEFTLPINLLKPKKQLEDELKVFTNTINTIIEIASVFINRLVCFHKSDNINDINGRAIYKDPDALFAKWQLYLEAYKLNRDGHDCNEIFNIIHGESNLKTVANPYFTVRLYVDSARKLIKAAEQGTFPYLLDEDLSTEAAN
jgi:hypothetical protein